MRSRPGPANGFAQWLPESLLGGLPPEIRKALLSIGQQKRYGGGYPLIQEGTNTRYVVLLVNASVKVTATTADGQVTLLAVRRSGDIVGELAGLDGQPRVATVTTVGTALVRLIPHADFLRFLHEHPAAAVALSRRVAEKLRATTRRRVDFGGAPVVVRLCRLLAELATEIGERPHRVYLTQYELATLVGAAEISVSRALRRLAREIVTSRQRTGAIRPRSLAGRRGGHRLSIRSWIQITAITVIALAVLIAIWQFSKAGGLWQHSVREDVQRAAALQEDVRYVYADEAALGFRVAAAEARADGLRALGNNGRLAASEYTIASQTAAALRQAALPDSLIGDATYARGALGYDVTRRLADLRARHPELRDLNPDATQARAHRHATYGTIAAGTGIVAAVIAAFAACTRAPVLRRRRARYSLPDVDLVPQPTLAVRGLRYATTLRLAVWALLAILPLTQLLLTGQVQRAQAEASRQAVHLTTSITASGQRIAFLTDSVQAALIADLGADARELAALDAADPTDAEAERAVAAAERGIAAHLRQAAETMGRAPTEADGLDPITVAALDSRPEDWPALRRSQNQQVDLVERASGQGLRVAAGTAIAAIAVTLVATAATGTAPRRRFRLLWALAFIAVSLTITATGALL